MNSSAKKLLALHQQADCLASAAQIDDALTSMATAISRELSNACPIVLCVMNGGLIPTAQLLLKLEFPLEVDYLHATRYGMDSEGGALEWRKYPTLPIKGRQVLVVDDVFDQGHTLTAVCDHLKQAGAARVLSAVTVNKLHTRKVSFRPDFVGLDLEDRFLYGFGMDLKGCFRNLNGIYALKET